MADIHSFSIIVRIPYYDLEVATISLRLCIHAAQRNYRLYPIPVEVSAQSLSIIALSANNHRQCLQGRPRKLGMYASSSNGWV